MRIRGERPRPPARRSGPPAWRSATCTRPPARAARCAGLACAACPAKTHQARAAPPAARANTHLVAVGQRFALGGKLLLLARQLGGHGGLVFLHSGGGARCSLDLLLQRLHQLTVGLQLGSHNLQTLRVGARILQITHVCERWAVRSASSPPPSPQLRSPAGRLWWPGF